MKNRFVRSAAVVMSAALIFGACGGDDPQEGANANAESEEQELTACPLTGEDIPSGVDVERPAVAIKVENSPEARPQSGIEKADIVIEEIVEGGITRFMAMYHCGSSDQVGPVRSARFDDANIAEPFTKVLAYSGSNDIVETEIKSEKMVAIQEDDAEGALFRDPPGTFDVHNLFADTEKLLKQVPDKGVSRPSEQIFVFGDVQDGAKNAKTITVNFTPSNTIEYKWQGGAWKRWEAGQPFTTVDGGQVSVENVLIQVVEVNDSKTIVDVTGAASPDITMEGTGKAVLFRDGRAIQGTWQTPGAGEAPRFETKKGEEFVFAPGQIWWELVPSKTGDRKGSFSFK